MCICKCIYVRINFQIFLFVAGDYSLDIRDVALEDDGKYQCQVSSGLNGELCIRNFINKLIYIKTFQSLMSIKNIN